MFLPQGVGILFTLIMQILSLLHTPLSVIQLLDSTLNALQHLLNVGLLMLIVYCVIFCLYGKYTNIPWISQMINRMLR